MSDTLATGIVSIALGVLGVATIAVIFSKKSNAAGVISAAGGALAGNIEAATNPYSGTVPAVNFNQTSSVA